MWQITATKNGKTRIKRYSSKSRMRDVATRALLAGWDVRVAPYLVDILIVNFDGRVMRVAKSVPADAGVYYIGHFARRDNEGMAMIWPCHVPIPDRLLPLIEDDEPDNQEVTENQEGLVTAIG